MQCIHSHRYFSLEEFTKSRESDCKTIVFITLAFAQADICFLWQTLPTSRVNRSSKLDNDQGMEEVAGWLAKADDVPDSVRLRPS
jgi:hypothetical protein